MKPQSMYSVRGKAVVIHEFGQPDIPILRDQLDGLIAGIKKNRHEYVADKFYFANLKRYQDAATYYDAHTAPPASASDGGTEKE